VPVLSGDAAVLMLESRVERENASFIYAQHGLSDGDKLHCFFSSA
jgi:hypothetical protein